MAFTRKIRDRGPRCTRYGCGAKATKVCPQCRATVCADCTDGHLRAHVKREPTVCVHG